MTSRMTSKAPEMTQEQRSEDGSYMGREYRLYAALQALSSLVLGECPRLLDEDRGGDGRLSDEINELLGWNK